MLLSTVASLERLVLLVHNGATALVQGIALGVLDTQQLEQWTDWRYHRSSTSYACEPYLSAGLFVWERVAVQRFFPPGTRVLVAAAGAGREMIALAEGGLAADGFDCCEPLVDAGRLALSIRGIQARLDLVPPSMVPDLGERYDGIIVGFSGYMYIPERGRRVAFLRRLGALLEPGAPLMLSFTEGYAGRRRRWTAEIGTTIRRLRGAEPVEEGDWIKDGFQHHFDRRQIESEMGDAGFDMEYYVGGTCYGHAVGRARECDHKTTNSSTVSSPPIAC